MASTEVICYCGNQVAANSSVDNVISQQQQHNILCQPCANRRLSSQISRHHSASERHGQKREECHRRLLDTRLPPADAKNNNDASSRHHLEPLSSRQPLPDPSRINQRASRLKQRLDVLRSQSNDLAVRVAAKTMENDEREERLQEHSAKVRLARERLDRMRQCLLVGKGPNLNDSDGRCDGAGGGLNDALVSGTRQIQTLRFHFACRVFDMHRLDMGEQYSKEATKTENENNDGTTKKSNESATGVGKIGGLPLPHAGPVLYGVIPPLVLASSLRLVASLTQLVARCLGVVLPHPILVCFKECRRCGAMYDFGGDVIDATNDDECDEDEEYLDDSEHDSGRELCDTCCNEGASPNNATAERPQQLKSQLSASSVQSNRRSSLLSLVGSSARKAIAITSSATSRAITHMQQSPALMESGSSSILPYGTLLQNTHTAKSAPNEVPKSFGSISRRINHASFTFLRENNDKTATEYVLNPPRWKEEGNATKATISETSKKQSQPNHGTKNAQTFSSREEFHLAEEKFATGMQLLQNDVVALCFRAGVDVSNLWPAESVLLNLNSLWRHCQIMARGVDKL